MIDAPIGGVTGRYAGPISRLVAFAIDITAIVALFSVIANVAIFCVNLLFNRDISAESSDNVWWLLAYGGWAFLYFAVSLGITGRTIGKWLVGIRVVERDGRPLRSGPACLRVLALPFSFLFFGLGLVGGVIGRERRALHDVVAGSVEVYDWGDRPAEMPAPLTRWLSRQGAMDAVDSREVSSPG